ncbi:MAG: ABC transporter substrate-binding protein [Anaerolineae bacterium]
MGDAHYVPRTAKYVIFTLLIAYFALWLAPDITAWLNRKPDEAWARVRQTGVIRFAIDPSYMPFDGLGSHNDFFGIDVEIAQEIARRLGVKVDFVVTGNDSLYDAVKVGQAEAVISALIVDPNRTSHWKYSTSYFDAGQVLIRPQQSSPADRVSSIAVEFGSDGDAAARKIARRQASVSVKNYSTADEALQAVVDGTADAAILDRVSAAQLLAKKYPTLEITEQATNDPYAIAVWESSEDLLSEINTTLELMRSDGTLQRIIDGWLTR